MIKLINKSVVYKNGRLVRANASQKANACGTMAYKILSAHNLSKDVGKLNVKFDEITSHDIT